MTARRPWGPKVRAHLSGEQAGKGQLEALHLGRARLRPWPDARSALQEAEPWLRADAGGWARLPSQTFLDAKCKGEEQGKPPWSCPALSLFQHPCQALM